MSRMDVHRWDLASRYRGRGRIAFYALATLTMCACGADNGDTGDGGVPACSMSLSVSPSQVFAPGQVVVSAEIARIGGASGLETFTWVVRQGATPLPWQSFGIDDRSIVFAASSAGSYEVIVSGTVGPVSCSDGIVDITALDPGATPGVYRLRVVPPPSLSLPPQERLVTVTAQDEIDLGPLSLDPGLAVAGTLAVSAGTNGPGYVRLTSSFGTVEVFADDDGGFATRLPLADHDVLVIPADPTLAPYRTAYFAGASAFSPSPGAARTVAVDVLDPSGAPLAGARVALTSDDVPSTVATTDGGGHAAVESRPGSALALRVSPPTASGLPEVVMSADASFAASSSVVVAYASALETAMISPLVRVGGVAAPNARVSFIAALPAVAEVADGGAAVTVAGSVFRRAVTDGAGSLGPIVLPHGIYDVVVTTVTGEDAVGTVIVGGTPLVEIAAPAQVTVSGRLVDAAATPLAGVVLIASPRHSLLRGGGTDVRVTTAADGTFVTPVAANGEYILRSQPSAQHPVIAEAELTVSSAPVALGDLVAPPTLSIRGVLVAPGFSGGVGATSLVLWPHGQTALETPIAESVTRVDGSFDLVVPAGI